MVIGLQPADEGVEPLGARTVDDDRVVRRAGDVHRQRHLVALRERGLELGGVGARREGNVDDGPHVVAQRPRVEARGIAADDAGLFQPPHAIRHRTGGEMHPVGQLTPADPTVGLQDADDSSVDSVKYRRFDGHVSSLPEKQPLTNGSTRPKMAPMIMTVGVPKEIKTTTTEPPGQPSFPPLPMHGASRWS